MVLLLFSLPIILHFCLGKQRTPNKGWFILRTPTDAVYISRVAAVTNVYVFTPPAAPTLLPCITCHGWWIPILEYRQRSSDNFPYFQFKKWRRRENATLTRIGGEVGGGRCCNIGESRPLMLAFVIIPMTNAASERAFSMVRKIETDFRSELAQDTTCALLTNKISIFNRLCSCQTFKCFVPHSGTSKMLGIV